MYFFAFENSETHYDVITSSGNWGDGGHVSPKYCQRRDASPPLKFQGRGTIGQKNKEKERRITKWHRPASVSAPKFFGLRLMMYSDLVHFRQ